jgi:hypothetical protein
LNSNFSVWQRGTSVVGGAGGRYVADRWFLYAGGQATTSRQATSDTTNLPNIQYCARVQRNSGQTDTTGIPLAQSFETVNSIPFAGKTVTLSYYARCGANFSATSNLLYSYLYTGTGTDQNWRVSGYTGQANPIAQTATLTTTWQRFTFTATLATNITELTLDFSFAPTGTAGANDYFEITGVQLEHGSVATPYAPNGATYQAELAACQRYYYRLPNGAYVLTTAYGGGGVIGVIQNPVPMRVAATSTEYSSVSFYDGVNAAISASAVALWAQSNTNVTGFTTSGSTGLIQYRPYIMQASYLGFNAEL